MRLFPFHDAAGLLYPELDTRHVTAPVLALYLGVERTTVWERALKNAYGRTPAEGAWFDRGPGNHRKRGHWTFRPALIWRRLGWGRYAQVGFDARQLEATGRVFCCDPAITAARLAQHVPAEIPAEFRAVLQHLSGAHLEALSLMRRLVPDGSAIPFTLTVDNH